METESIPPYRGMEGVEFINRDATGAYRFRVSGPLPCELAVRQGSALVIIDLDESTGFTDYMEMNSFPGESWPTLDEIRLCISEAYADFIRNTMEVEQ